MPRVEIERLRGALPTSTGQPRASTAGVDVSGSLGRALQQEGEVLTNLGLKAARKIKVARDNEYLTSATVDSSEEILRFEKEFQKSSAENPAGYTEAYINEVDDIYATYLGNAPSQESHNQLAQMFASQRTNKFKSAIKFEEQATVDNFVSASEENLNIISNRLADDPSTLPQSQLEIDQLVNNAKAILPPKQASKFEEFAGNTLTRATLSGLADRGQYDAARDFLGNENVRSMFSATEIDKLEDSINRDEAAQLDQERKQATAEYNLFIDSTKKNIVLGQTTEVELMTAFQEGAFRDTGDFIALDNLLKNRRKQESNKVSDIQRVDQARTSGMPLNPGSKQDRKKADTYYNEVILGTTPPEDLQARTHDFILSIGTVPEGIKGNLVSSLFNGTPDQSIGAAITIDGLIQAEPSIAKSFSNKELVMSRRMSAGIQSGLTPEEVVKAEDNKVRLATQEVKSRESALASSDPVFDHGEITSFFVNDPDDVPQELITDWENLVTTFAVDLGSDPDDAKALAYKRIQAQWNISAVTGDEQYMKQAPEIFYGVPNVNPEWMATQLSEDLAPFGELDTMNLRVDPESNPQEPQYLITHKLQGFEVPLVDAEGNILTWNPDWNEFNRGQLEAAQLEREDFLRTEQIEQDVQSVREGF